LKSEAVVDASIVLAVLNEEQGAEQMIERIGSLVLSAVNAAEVQSVLVRSGMERSAAWLSAQELVGEVAPFDAQQAELAGNLISRTKSYGLSLGDRACLALGLSRGLPVYTTDRNWGKVRAGVEIHVIR